MWEVWSFCPPYGAAWTATLAAVAGVGCRIAAMVGLVGVHRQLLPRSSTLLKAAPPQWGSACREGPQAKERNLRAESAGCCYTTIVGTHQVLPGPLKQNRKQSIALDVIVILECDSASSGVSPTRNQVCTSLSSKCHFLTENVFLW